MSKSLTVAVSLSLALGFVGTFGTPAVAGEKTLEIPNVATITYPSTVKLVPRGCQTIRFKYTAPDLDENFGYMTWAISDPRDNQIAGHWFNKGTIMIQAGPQYPTAKRLGTVKVKICRNKWSTRWDDNLGAKRGTYEVWLAAVPGGEMDALEVYGTITFR
jgi:hypothetical protein